MSDNLQQAADREESGKGGNNRLLSILGLVFLTAFVLLIFSMLMEHRFDDLHNSVSNLQTVIEEREALREDVRALEEERDELQDKLENLTSENQQLSRDLFALQTQLAALQEEASTED